MWIQKKFGQQIGSLAHRPLLQDNGTMKVEFHDPENPSFIPIFYIFGKGHLLKIVDGGIISIFCRFGQNSFLFPLAETPKPGKKIFFWIHKHFNKPIFPNEIIPG